MKVLLDSFHLYGHTLRPVHPHTEKIQLTSIASRFDSGSEKVKLYFSDLRNIKWRLCLQSLLEENNGINDEKGEIRIVSTKCYNLIKSRTDEALAGGAWERQKRTKDA